MSLSPHTTPALKSDDDVVPVRGLSFFWGAIAAGVKPNECLALVLSISYENRFIHYDTGIAATLSLRYDDCRRPIKGRPSQRIGKQN